MTTALQSYATGSWQTGIGEGSAIRHAVNGQLLFTANSEGLDFSQMRTWAIGTGGPALRALTFHQRAAILKQLAQYLLSRKEELYELSTYSGATRGDSWIDIEGGIATLFTYSSKARRELPNLPYHVEGPPEQTSKHGTFIGQHICVPLEGVAVHINAFNFPCWGMLEKLAPTWLAGMPAIVKPATVTSYLAQKLVLLILESGLLPPGSLQIVCGRLGTLFEMLTYQDVVTFTGSKATGLTLRSHPRLLDQSVRFTMESDSLNCTILGQSAAPGTAEFDLFVREVAKELTVKAGQKCTVIRRVLIPTGHEDAVRARLQEALAQVTIGDPERPDVRMGPLVSKEQVADVAQQVLQLRNATESFIELDNAILANKPDEGAFYRHTVLYCANPLTAEAVHQVEAFGPVCTVMSYRNIDEAIQIAQLGGGSLCASIFSSDEQEAKTLALGLAPHHGRILLLNESCAKESTGHGSPLPHLVHGGPGRAGGGEELGGIRSVLHYMQRTALQGSPTRLSNVCERWIPGSAVTEDRVHPFRKFYEELTVGDCLVTHRRTITEADVQAFAGLSGDFFYAHVDEIAARDSLFKQRVAHGYLILSVAAGLFVHPAPGPVLANYGLENLRFIKPVYIGDTIQARLICKEKTPRDDRGVVSWHVEVSNQLGEIVASYVVLTLVARRG